MVHAKHGPTLVLFDIDGTLVESQGAGRRALDGAFQRLFGLAEGSADLFLAGRTDRGIFRQMLRHNGLADTPEQMARVEATYLEVLAQEVRRDPGYPLPGVPGILHFLQAHDVRLALGTGNIERGAQLKLAPFELMPFFPSGGFGSDAEDRAEVIACAIRRARTHYGEDFGRICVVGDTPRDIEAARRNGILVVAVATGAFSLAALQRCEPDLAVPDLAQGVEAILQLLGVTASAPPSRLDPSAPGTSRDS